MKATLALLGGVCLLALLGLAIGAKPSPVLQIIVGESKPISVDDPAARHVESFLAISPRDPRNLIAASMVFGTRSGIAVYASADGGRSWTRGAQGPGVARSDGSSHSVH